VRTPNRKDESGNASQAWDRTHSDRPEQATAAACSRGTHATIEIRCGNVSPRQANQDVARSEPLLMSAKPLPQHALCATSVDRAREDTLRNDDTQPGETDCVGLEHDAETGAFDRARSEQGNDIPVPEPLRAAKAPAIARAQTPNRARPLARRARSTARPPRVRIRTRNPCVRFLRTTEGWKVRFI